MTEAMLVQRFAAVDRAGRERSRWSIWCQ